MAIAPIPNFSLGKLYLKGDGSTEWTEVKPEVESFDFTPSVEFDCVPINHTLSFTWRIKPFSKKKQIEIMQFFGRLKKPKCTYKTIKRDCAKRNR